MNIYVSNLAYSVTDDDLRQLFESYGAVDKVSIITDRDTGQSRGFGFVEMSTEAEAQDAIKRLDGQPFEGRPLKVNVSKPQGSVSRTGGGPGGGAGRGRPGRW